MPLYFYSGHTIQWDSPPKIYFQRIPVHASDSHVGVFYPLQIVQISPTLLREQVSNLD